MQLVPNQRDSRLHPCVVVFLKLRSTLIVVLLGLTGEECQIALGEQTITLT